MESIITCPTKEVLFPWHVPEILTAPAPYWNYAKLISGILRYGMPLENVIALISSLQLDSDNMNTWVSGVSKALKRYVYTVSSETEDTQNAQNVETIDD